MTECMVHFFEEVGVENTDHVIEATKQRIRQGDVSKVLVASESGRLALRAREEIPLSVPLICVTYNRQTRKVSETIASRHRVSNVINKGFGRQLSNG